MSCQSRLRVSVNHAERSTANEWTRPDPPDAFDPVTGTSPRTWNLLHPRPGQYRFLRRVPSPYLAAYRRTQPFLPHPDRPSCHAEGEGKAPTLWAFQVREVGNPNQYSGPRICDVLRVLDALAAPVSSHFQDHELCRPDNDSSHYPGCPGLVHEWKEEVLNSAVSVFDGNGRLH